MKQTIEDKVSIIRESFRAGRADLMEMSGSFRVGFEFGQTAYIYVETDDNAITVRFETNEADFEKRGHEIDKLRDALLKEISVADISDFVEAQSVNDRFVYTACVDIDASVFFHETIVIGDNKTEKDEILSIQEGEEESLPDLFGIETEGSVVLSPVEQAIEQLETIDAKMLRQSLDMMNLKRSSNVRVALTRIFRSAGDTEELMMRSIQNEAGKLTSQKDHEELRMIKKINADGFLEPVIRLLYAEVFGENLNS